MLLYIFMIYETLPKSIDYYIHAWGDVYMYYIQCVVRATQFKSPAIPKNSAVAQRLGLASRRSGC